MELYVTLIIGVGGAAVAAGGVDLADDEAARAAPASRRGGQRQGESREQDEQVDPFHGASDRGEWTAPCHRRSRRADSVLCEVDTKSARIRARRGSAGDG